MAYDSSAKNEPKRSHQWFMDGTESDLFPNKRQAVEVPSNTFFPGMANLNVSPWGTVPGFHSVPTQFTQRVFDSETDRTVNYEDRNIPSFSAGDMNMNLGRKVEDFFGINSSIGLSTSHSLDDPRSGLYYGGIRKAKVNQVKDPDNAISASMGGAYSSGDSDSAPKALHKEGEDSISMGLTYSGGDKNVISRNETFNREDSSFISMGQHYNKGNENMFVGQPFNEGDANISVNHAYKENNGSISVSQQFSNVQTYKKDDNSFMSMGPATHALTEGGARVSASTLTYNNSYHDQSSISRSCNKRESNIISFGDFRDDDETDPSGRLLCSYDFLMGQPSVQRSEAPNEELNPNAFTSVSQVIASGSETVPKKKETQKLTKKAPPNNFPSNVRSLLSTGMLDGVPVKYIAWSREKQLCGVIKGSGYLCGCQQCNSSKVVNAYEFERHAGCKTKHPNNHIYFENGKTIYAIVQELRSTPQNLLFEVIQTITGSPINQKSFRLWKESFLAATRELQRIYGKDEGGQLS